MDAEKVFLGLPAYGWNWQIYDASNNLGKTIAARPTPTTPRRTG
jgi:spore germination protein YaaH